MNKIRPGGMPARCAIAIKGTGEGFSVPTSHAPDSIGYIVCISLTNIGGINDIGMSSYFLN